MKTSQKYLALQILKLVGIGVLFTTVSLLSPNFLYEMLKRYLKYRLRQPYKRKQIHSAVDYLKRKNFIACTAKSNNNYFLTKIGRARLLELQVSEVEINKSVWDKKWRLITFDIPEKQKPARFRFRRKLKDLGFFHFQRSVFIIPYPCDKQINIIAKYLGIQAFVQLLTAERFPNDQVLVKHFKLS